MRQTFRPAGAALDDLVDRIDRTEHESVLLAFFVSFGSLISFNILQEMKTKRTKVASLWLWRAGPGVLPARYRGLPSAGSARDKIK